jgi:hypothetical protein
MEIYKVEKTEWETEVTEISENELDYLINHR